LLFFPRQKNIVKLLLDTGANPGLKIDNPESKMNGISILAFAHKARNNAKTDQDREELNETIDLLSASMRTPNSAYPAGEAEWF
jgi:hypothetical protein